LLVIDFTRSRVAEEQVRRVQIYDCELGLKEPEALCNKEERTDIPLAPNLYSATPDAATMLTITQDQIGKIQWKLALERDKIANRKATLNPVFLMLYAVGSVSVLVGSILNAVVSSKVSEAESHARKR
jgi:hypothetical protein